MAMSSSRSTTPSGGQSIGSARPLVEEIADAGRKTEHGRIPTFARRSLSDLCGNRGSTDAAVTRAKLGLDKVYQRRALCLQLRSSEREQYVTSVSDRRLITLDPSVYQLLDRQAGRRPSCRLGRRSFQSAASPNSPCTLSPPCAANRLSAAKACRKTSFARTRWRIASRRMST